MQSNVTLPDGREVQVLRPPALQRVLVAIAAVLCVAILVGTGISILSADDPQGNRTLGVVLLAALALPIARTLWRAVQLSVRLFAERLIIRNVGRTHFIAKSEIQHFVPVSSHVRPAGGGVKLEDGTVITMTAIVPRSIEERDKLLGDLNAWLTSGA